MNLVKLVKLLNWPSSNQATSKGTSAPSFMTMAHALNIATEEILQSVFKTYHVGILGEGL